MQSLKTMVRDTVSEVFASREEREKEGSIATPGAMPVIPAVEGIAPPPSPFVFPPAAEPHHALKRWPWVLQDTIDLIDHGRFEIDSHPKLHQSDELHNNAYLRRALKGIYQPLEGGPPEIIIGNTKLQSSVKDSAMFFLGWHIYVSIRSEFKPSMAPGLANWTERVLYFAQMNYPWSSILEYIIAYYQTYQKFCFLSNTTQFVPVPKSSHAYRFWYSRLLHRCRERTRHTMPQEHAAAPRTLSQPLGVTVSLAQPALVALGADIPPLGVL